MNISLWKNILQFKLTRRDDLIKEPEIIEAKMARLNPPPTDLTLTGEGFAVVWLSAGGPAPPVNGRVGGGRAEGVGGGGGPPEGGRVRGWWQGRLWDKKEALTLQMTYNILQ